MVSIYYGGPLICAVFCPLRIFFRQSPSRYMDTVRQRHSERVLGYAVASVTRQTVAQCHSAAGSSALIYVRKLTAISGLLAYT